MANWASDPLDGDEEAIDPHQLEAEGFSAEDNSCDDVRGGQSSDSYGSHAGGTAHFA